MQHGSSSVPAVPRAAVAADIAAAVLVAIGIAVLIIGPTPRTYVLGVRLSMSSPDRAVLLALVILVVRHLFVPRHPRLSRFLRRGATNEADEANLDRSRAPLPRRLGEIALVTAAFAALVSAVTWPQVASLHAVPDFGDPLFSTWRIAWIAHQVVRDPLHLFNGNIFHPESLTLTYSDSILAPAAMSAPFLWLGAHQLSVYTVLLLSGFALSGVTTYVLVRALTGRRDAAAIAGVLFAVAPYRFEHYSHLELQMALWMPLTLLGLHRTIAHGRLRDGLVTGGAFALQTLSSLYYGLFLAVYLVPVGAALWLAKGRPRRPLRALAAGALLSVIIIAPVAAQYLRNTAVLGERADDEVRYYSATPADYVTPHFRSRWYGAWSDGGHPERQLFPGIVPVALTAVALWPPLSAVRIGYAAALLLAIDGSFGLNGVVFGWLREWLTPYRGLRVPARFAIMVVLSLAILSGYAAAAMFRRWPRYRPALAAALLTAAIVEPWPRLELKPAWSEPPDIYASIPSSAPAVIAEFPIGTDDHGIYFDTRYIYFSTFHWHTLINGNSGFLPPSFDAFLESASSIGSSESIAYLQSRGVDYITIHGPFLSERRFNRAVAALRRQPDVELVDRVVWEDSESRLYRLVR